jgi:hypothetical protein
MLSCVLRPACREPDRHWSSVDEIDLPERSLHDGCYELDGQTDDDIRASASYAPTSPGEHAAAVSAAAAAAPTPARTAPAKPFGPEKPAWSFGPRKNHRDSFFCTHISGVQRLANGNSLITMGPQGILTEVTAAGEEVWRYVSPCVALGAAGHNSAVSFVRQGEHRPECDRRSLFRVTRYAYDGSELSGRELCPVRYLEA